MQAVSSVYFALCLHIGPRFALVAASTLLLYDSEVLARATVAVAHVPHSPMDSLAQFLLPSLFQVGWRILLRDLTAFRAAAPGHRAIVDFALASAIAVLLSPASCPLHCFVDRLIIEEGHRDDLDRTICNEIELDFVRTPGWSPPSWYSDSEWGD